MDKDPLMVNCGCYIDNGISGRFIGARKDFKRMMQDAELHKIDYILCKSIILNFTSFIGTYPPLFGMTHITIDPKLYPAITPK